MTERAAPSALSRDDGVALAGLLVVVAVTLAWWALALWPVGDGPEWLARTRYACFGVSGDALPDAGGWIGLVGAPLGMLLMLGAGWGATLLRLARRARTSRVLGATFTAIALALMLLVTGAAARVQQARGADWLAEPEAVPSTYPRLDRDAPAFELLAHDGETRTLADFAGRSVLLTFAYAHCETVCPVIVREVLAAQAARARDGAAPIVLVVTLDPWRDTPSRLAPMAAEWGLPAQDAWILGGEVEAVEATLDAWEVPRTRNLRTGEVTHPSLVYVLDRDGRIAYASTGGVEALTALLDRL